MKVRRLQEGSRGWVWALAVCLVKPLLLATTKRTWIDGDKIPARGGALLVVNHISEVDPLTMAHIVWDHGRIPRYLAKDELFRNRLLGSLLRAAGQIPVYREARNAVDAYEAAVAAIRAGRCVVVYPEGTITRDPGLWPMTGKSGAARIALATGAPAIPVGQWGAHLVLPPYSKRLDVFPRKQVTIKVGDPVQLGDLTGDLSARSVALATERIMDALTDLVEDIRGEAAPAVRFDPRRPEPPQAGAGDEGRRGRAS